LPRTFQAVWRLFYPASWKRMPDRKGGIARLGKAYD
jgi:hypothetical protein